jgi:hypothetical protein
MERKLMVAFAPFYRPIGRYDRMRKTPIVSVYFYAVAYPYRFALNGGSWAAVPVYLATLLIWKQERLATRASATGTGCLLRPSLR